jgi:hypothetical protein
MDCTQISSQQNNFVLSNRKQSEWSGVLNQYFGYPYDLNYASNVVMVLSNLSIVWIRFAYHSDPEFMSSEFVVYNDNNDQTIMPTVINSLFPTIVIFDTGLTQDNVVNTLEIKQNKIFVCNLIYTFDGFDVKYIKHSVSKTFQVYFKIQPIPEANMYKTLYISFAYGWSFSYRPIEYFRYIPSRVEGGGLVDNNYALKLCSNTSFIEYGINGTSSSDILADSILSVRIYCDVFNSIVKLPETPRFGYFTSDVNSIDKPMIFRQSVFLNLIVFFNDSLIRSSFPLFMYVREYSEDIWTPNSTVRQLTDGCFVGTGNVYIPIDTQKIKIGFEYIDRRSSERPDIFEYNNFGEYFTYNVKST